MISLLKTVISTSVIFINFRILFFSRKFAMKTVAVFAVALACILGLVAAQGYYPQSAVGGMGGFGQCKFILSYTLY